MATEANSICVEAVRVLAYVSFHYVSYKKFVLGQIEMVLANVMDENMCPRRVRLFNGVECVIGIGLILYFVTAIVHVAVHVRCS